MSGKIEHWWKLVDERSGEMGDEDARRLVACWNACEGIDTEDLEAANVSIIHKLHDDASKRVLAQRDELLEALEDAHLELRDAGKHMAASVASEAIAKVKGATP